MPVLVVQRGHCYRKTGATGTTGEQEYASAVANACVNLLHGRGGWTVRAILADDSTSRYVGDAFVAIHCDGSTSASARGASVGYRNAAGQRFGQAWKRAYAARGWTAGFRPDNYTEALRLYYGTGNAISQGNTRAFIAECGFMTNSQDRALLTGPGGPTRVALAIGDALGIHTQGDDDVMNEAQYKVLVETQRRVSNTYAVAVENQQRITAGNAAVTALAALISKGTNDLTAEQVAATVEASVAKALQENTVHVDIDVTGTEGN